LGTLQKICTKKKRYFMLFPVFYKKKVQKKRELK